MNRAFIFIGSNIERERNYLDALRRLCALGNLVALSSVYDTAPVGTHAGDNFYNGAVLLDTELSARALKRALRAIERALGRVRADDPNAPRTIDLDLVLYNDAILRENDLRVPDPLILERGFMAAALAELDPLFVHPSDGRTLRQIAQTFGASAAWRVDETMTRRAHDFIKPTYLGEKYA